MGIKKTIFPIFFLLFPVITVAQNLSNKIVEEKLKEYSTVIAVKRIPLLKLLFVSSKNHKTIADSLKAKVSQQLYFAYQDSNQLDSATYYSQISYQFWKTHKTSNPKEYANAAYMVAYYYHIRFYYSQAIEYYKIAINSHPKDSYKAYCYSLIASLYGSLGDVEEEKLNLLKAKATLKDPSQDYLTATEIYNHLAINENHSKKNDEALKYLAFAEKNYAFFVKNGTKDDNLLADIYVNYGVAYAGKSNFIQAKYYYKSAEKLFKSINKKKDILSKIYSNQLAEFAEKKDFANAEIFLNKSVQLLDELNLPEKSRQKTLVYYNCGYFQLQKNNYTEALPYFSKSIKAFPLLQFNENKLFQNIRDKSFLLMLFKDYAKAFYYSYKATKSQVYLKNCLLYFTYADVVIDLMRQEHQGQQSKSFWREHSRSLYESAIEACYLAKDAPKAFYFLEKSRAMLLLDDLKENNARKLLSVTEQEKEKNFQQKLLELQIQLEQKKEQSPDYQKVISDIAFTKLAFNDFKKDLEKRLPAYYAVKYNEDFKDLATLQHWLGATKHQAFVAYFVGDSATYAMKITPTDTKLVKLPKDKQNIANSFTVACSDLNFQNTNFSRFLTVSNSLYHQLIEPVSFPEGRIIISYDGYFIPFEAINQSATKSQFLVEHHAISYAYSANFLLRNIENKNQQTYSFGSTSFLGIAPVNFNKSLSINDLPLSKKSITNIENTFSGKLLLQNEATKRAFISQFYDYQLVQLYTHANADTTQKEPIFYLQDAPIRVSEIRHNQTMKTQMIVLSACKTGLGRNVKGEGVFSLSRGFSALGIPSLITTLWSVNEKATYDLTELFYKGLKEGLPKDLALQKAKLTYIRQSNRNELPNLWASSILIGDTSKIDNQSQNWLILLSILCTGFIAFTLYRKYK